MRYRIWIVALAFAVSAGCGSCGDDTAGAGPEEEGGATAGDGATAGGTSPDGALADGAIVDGPTDGWTSDTNGCGGACSGKEVCTDGDCICPRYHEPCNGECVPTHVDPDNCGGCGNSCGSNEVCSAGGCAEECYLEREPCDRQCIDTTTDPDNCGGCGESCADGEGCIDGSCVEAIDVGEAPDKCEGGGPQIDIQAKADGRDRCLGNVAKNVFRWGICSCDELVFQNHVRTDAYDSSLGPYQPGGLGAGVGTNATLDAQNEAYIRGTTWASGTGGATFRNTTELHQQLHVGGDADFRDETGVRKDAWIDGNVVTESEVEFQQTLYVEQNSDVPGSVSYGQLNRTNVDVGQACERCDPASHIPVDQIVDAHAGSDNDNDLIELDADALASQSEKTVLILPCGEYYLSSIDVSAETTILATGRTALYIGGDVDIGNHFTIKPTATGELDVFIAGDVLFRNQSWLGDPAYPASTRFYVGGSGGWEMGNIAEIGAYIYAIPGGITAENHLKIYGGIYTQDLDAGNEVDVHYDRAVLDAGKNCSPPDSDPPDGDPDAGSGDVSDGGGPDGGGTTPACAESGESCSSDGDCCVPLVCGADGTCDVKECRALYESCTDDSDCCSGTCAESGGDSVCLGG